MRNGFISRPWKIAPSEDFRGGIMSDKEALDRLANKIPGDIIVDGFVFKATEIASMNGKALY